MIFHKKMATGCLEKWEKFSLNYSVCIHNNNKTLTDYSTTVLLRVCTMEVAV